MNNYFFSYFLYRYCIIELYESHQPARMSMSLSINVCMSVGSVWREGREAEDEWSIGYLYDLYTTLHRLSD